MDTATLTKSIGLARVAIGLAFVVAPGPLARLWTGAEADREQLLRGLAVGLGARDLAIGLGTFLAARGGQPSARWLQAGAISDAADAATTLLNGAHTPPTRRLLIAALAGSAAVGGIALSLVDSR